MRWLIQDAEIGPVPASGGGRKPELELDLLSNIVRAFNDQFGNIDWKDADKIRKVIAEEFRRIRPTGTRCRTRTGRMRGSSMTGH